MSAAASLRIPARELLAPAELADVLALSVSVATTS